MTIEINPAEDSTGGVSRALVGRRVVSIARIPESEIERDRGSLGDAARLTLDDGTEVELVGHDGGCGCWAGCYTLDSLAELSELDNIITDVQFEAAPDSEDDPSEGAYRVFVFAENKKINLATFTGTDGNGYYGSGYFIRVKLPATLDATA